MIPAYYKTLLDDFGRKNGVPYGIRTRVASVKGRCPGPLDEGDVCEVFLKDRGLFDRRSYTYIRPIISSAFFTFFKKNGET